MPIMGEPNKNGPRTLGPRPASEPCIPQPAMQRVHEHILQGEYLESARDAEAARKLYDPFYITAEEARAIPPEVRTPEVLQRIKYSQRDWPENRMGLTAALGPLQPGEGEQYLRRGMDAGEMFWEPGNHPDGPGPRGRRPEDHHMAIQGAPEE